MSSQVLEKIESAVGYVFNNKELLKQALTLSFSAKAKNNQRLEFLGDSVLGLVIADYLYKSLPRAQEGILTRIKSYLVSRAVLYRMAVYIGLDEILKLKPGMNRRKALADTMEAIVGAMYEDSGNISTVYKVVVKLWEPVIDSLGVADLIGPKERLQIYTQSLGMDMPEYSVIEVNGPKHKPEFIIGVYVAGRLIGTGRGHNKKSAEKMAATIALKNMGLEV